MKGFETSRPKVLAGLAGTEESRPAMKGFETRMRNLVVHLFHQQRNPAPL